MDYRLSPPTKGFKSFELRRQYGDNEVELLVMGNSYLLNHPELSGWLMEVGCNQPVKVVDWAWNYRRILFDLDEQKMIVPQDQVIDSSQREVEDLAAATLGKHTPLDALPDTSIFDDPAMSRTNTNTQWIRR